MKSDHKLYFSTQIKDCAFYKRHTAHFSYQKDKHLYLFIYWKVGLFDECRVCWRINPKKNRFCLFSYNCRGACRRWHNSKSANVKLVFFCCTVNDRLSCASLQKIFHCHVFPGFDSLTFWRWNYFFNFSTPCV